MLQWPKMKEILKPAKVGEFSIVHYELSERELRLAQLRDAMNYRREHVGQKPGVIVQLKGEYGTVMMSDTEMEHRTNSWFLLQANGNVLIGGLGLGIVLLVAQAKEVVNFITVVELHQEVIDLVVPQLPLNEKTTVLCGDILKWYPPKGVLYDVMYFDIWNSVCGDHYEDMKRLHRRFARRLNRANPACWMGSWRREDCKKAYKESGRWY